MLKTNVLQGEVQRSWVWVGHDGAKRVIDLYHDTVTGVRSVSVDLDEVPGSMGSSPFFATDAHHIQFLVGAERAQGMVIIEKAGLFSFRYTCVVNGRPLKATLQELADENEERFTVDILGTANAFSTKEHSVTWYELTVTRRSDRARTVVHRRYREFQCLFEQVHAAFKGHHLRSSLPDLPGRQLKLLVDHSDTAFVEERRLLLETAVGKLLSVPHVCSMVPVQVFLGFFDKLKEHSVVFIQRDLGLSITRTVVPEESIVVSRVKEVGAGGQKARVMVGDTVSKVNGEPVSKYGGFDGVTFQISKGLRPIVIHFLQAVEKNPEHEFLPPGDPIEIPPVHEQLKEQLRRRLAQQQEQQAQAPPTPPPPPAPAVSVQARPAPQPPAPATTAAPAAAVAPPPVRPKPAAPMPTRVLPRADARPPGRGPPSRQRPVPSSSTGEAAAEQLDIDRISSKRKEEDPDKLQNVLEAALMEEEKRAEQRLSGSLETSSSIPLEKDPLLDMTTSGREPISTGSSSSLPAEKKDAPSAASVAPAVVSEASAVAASEKEEKKENGVKAEPVPEVVTKQEDAVPIAAPAPSPPPPPPPPPPASVIQETPAAPSLPPAPAPAEEPEKKKEDEATPVVVSTEAVPPPSPPPQALPTKPKPEALKLEAATGAAPAETKKEAAVSTPSPPAPPAVASLPAEEHPHNHLHPIHKPNHHNRRRLTPPRIKRTNEEEDESNGEGREGEEVPPSPFEDYM